MNFECKQIKPKNWKEKAGLPCKYSTLPLLNPSARSGVDVVPWPFSHSLQHVLQGSLPHAGRIKYELPISSRTTRTTSGPACS